MQAFEKIFQFEIVLFQSLLMTALNDRETRARKHARKFTFERFIDCSNLREVGYLSRAAYVSCGRQKEILHDWSQRHVRAETIGTAASKFDKLFFVKRTISALYIKSPLALSHRKAAAIVHYEKRRHVFRHVHLRVIASFFKLSAACYERFGNLGRFFNGLRVKRRD